MQEKPVLITDLSRQEYITAYEDPKNEHVLETCIWLKAFKDKIKAKDNREANHVLSVLSRLGSPGTLIKEYFENKPRFDLKRLAEEAQRTPGPITCKTVGKNFNCTACPKFKKVSSPIEIKGNDYIESQATGFYLYSVEKDGQKVPSNKPDYRGLVKYYTTYHEYKTVTETGITYKYKDQHWQITEPIEFEAFADEHLNPKPDNRKCSEFKSIFKRTNLVPMEYFFGNNLTKVNLNNCVYDFEEDKVYPHSPEFGMTYKLPYDFDENAECPTFTKFIKDITCNNPQLETVLLEYLGYCLAGSPCKAHKALILLGEGGNGKSTLLEVLKALAGKGNYSAYTLSALNNPQNRAGLENMLFNIGEETNRRALADSEIFKTLVTGGEVDVKRLYHQPYSVVNKAKIIVSANSIPTSNDKTDGLYRRLVIVPFNAVFSAEKGNVDVFIEEKLRKELPGIFNLAIKHFRNLKKNSYRFAHAEAIKNMLVEYKYENDNVIQFLKDECTQVPATHKHFEETFTPKKKIYNRYSEFCRETGTKPVSMVNFYKTLKKEMKTFEEKRKTYNAQFVRCLMGIRLHD